MTYKEDMNFKTFIFMRLIVVSVRIINSDARWC